VSCKHSNREARRPVRRYFSLIAAGEPFRLLFPLGAAIGIAGVLMWPLFVWNFTKTYPGLNHSRIMIEGFLTCFVVGFLGTALPRLHFCGQTLLGDELFFLTLSALVVVLLARAVFRKDTPPPAFVLVALGLLSALAGSAIQALAQIAPTMVPALATSVARLLLNQGYLLLPVMGVGAFLLPRFFGLPSRQGFPESLALPPGWKGRALFALVCGLGVVASFFIEASGQVCAGCALRAAAVLVYFFREVPVHQAGLGGGTLALGLRIALFAIPGGFALMAAWPERVFSFLHVVFITGFSLLTLIVASRVVLGHSGQSEKFRAPLKPVRIMVSLVTFAMLTRVTADWMPAIRMAHYAYAAVAWIVGVLVWAAFILPGVRVADSEGG
jgi:uncharacterized protein involved in response to NO